jgi:hypothetical protein
LASSGDEVDVVVVTVTSTAVQIALATATATEITDTSLPAQATAAAADNSQSSTVPDSTILNMPIMDNSFSKSFDTTMDADLKANLKSTAGSFGAPSDPDLMPLSMYKFIKGQNMTPADFETYVVKYDDCNMTWTLARHKNTKTTPAEMAHEFMQIPIGMRQWVQ